MPWDPVPSSVTARWLAPDSCAVPPYRRVVAIDFETSGFRGTPPNCPAELAAWALDAGTSSPYEIFRAVIRGATRLDPWVAANTRLTLDDLTVGRDFAEVFADFQRQLREGDCIVAHNMLYDWRVIYNYAPSRGDDLAAAYPLRCSYHGPLSKALFELNPRWAEPSKETSQASREASQASQASQASREASQASREASQASQEARKEKESSREASQPSKQSRARQSMRSRRRLSDLCALQEVPYDHEEAHGASYDAERLIRCLSKYLEREKRTGALE